ncbi:hypothetical protein P700755_003987 [Psychroflexus torquis ATCC 700755]|jgi:hypothetical protein|uniref:Uncharacterized protein n=1 Tax=Psychroflexus torquis (strain ATCC 700755 / CIP 106069 / ACAM 623) TaxID=313595 RepID=K4IYK8_PSYTT|nr:hypothetical protein P700755_003987 [Psychroflexus torquis ATCC 700755]
MFKWFIKKNLMIIRELISSHNEQTLLLNMEKSKEKLQESILWGVENGELLMVF